MMHSLPESAFGLPKLRLRDGWTRFAGQGPPIHGRRRHRLQEAARSPCAVMIFCPPCGLDWWAGIFPLAAPEEAQRILDAACPKCGDSERAGRVYRLASIKEAQEARRR